MEKCINSLAKELNLFVDFVAWYWETFAYDGWKFDDFAEALRVSVAVVKASAY
jgi:hypothetical protein